MANSCSSPSGSTAIGDASDGIGSDVSENAPSGELAIEIAFRLSVPVPVLPT